jgi:hypothetical protein
MQCFVHRSYYRVYSKWAVDDTLHCAGWKDIRIKI